MLHVHDVEKNHGNKHERKSSMSSPKIDMLIARLAILIQTRKGNVALVSEKRTSDDSSFVKATMQRRCTKQQKR